jgi:hypothetical protein
MTLQARLDAFKADFKGGKAPYFAPSGHPSGDGARHRRTDRLRTAAGRALKVRRYAPRCFTLNDPEGRPVSSADRLATRAAGAERSTGASGARTAIMELQALQEVSACNSKTTGAEPGWRSRRRSAANSRKSQRHQRSWISRSSATPRNDVAAAFGLRFALPPYLVELYRNLKQRPARLSTTTRAWTLPMPARYVIGQDGMIRLRRGQSGLHSASGA